MIFNKKLADLVKNKKDQGFSEQELFDLLIYQGYDTGEVKEVIKSVYQPSPSTFKFVKKSTGRLFIIICLICGVVYFFNHQYKKDKSVEELRDNQSSEINIPDCKEFPNKLYGCEPFLCEEANVFGTSTKNILGVTEDRCVVEFTSRYKIPYPYGATSVNECKYTEDFRKEWAEYMRISLTDHELHMATVTNNVIVEVFGEKEFVHEGEHITLRAFDDSVCTEKLVINDLPELVDYCQDLPDKLENCEAFNCKTETLTLFGGLIVAENKVIGLRNGNCSYSKDVASVAGRYKMDCQLSEDVRKNVALYYREESVNIFEEAIDDGQCIVTVLETDRSFDEKEDYIIHDIGYTRGVNTKVYAVITANKKINNTISFFVQGNRKFDKEDALILGKHSEILNLQEGETKLISFSVLNLEEKSVQEIEVCFEEDCKNIEYVEQNGRCLEFSLDKNACNSNINCRYGDNGVCDWVNCNRLSESHCKNKLACKWVDYGEIGECSPKSCAEFDDKKDCKSTANCDWIGNQCVSL